MSKAYRDKKKRIGVQARHKGRRVHTLDDVLPLEMLCEEVTTLDKWNKYEQPIDMVLSCCNMLKEG